MVADRLNERAVSIIFLSIVLAQGAFLRLWRLNALGFNSDEVVYAGQAAAIANDPAFVPFFPIFRAHPLLTQFLLAVWYQFGVDDVKGRLIAVAFGLATILLTFQIGRLLYGTRVGLVAALFISLMPYHVIVSRQFLLDGPMVTFATLTLLCVTQYALQPRALWLYATGASMGLTFLAKETGIVMLGAVYAFFALSREIPVRLRDLAISLLCMVVVISPFPLSLWLAGTSKTGQNYLAWQLFRRPNHDWDFYLGVLPNALGWLVILAAVAGLVLLRRESSWREKLLVAWIVTPLLFFQLWPVKGFQYPLLIAPPLVILAGRALVNLPKRDEFKFWGRKWSSIWVRSLLVSVIVLSLVAASWQNIQATSSNQFLAGTGGVPGGREAGEWVRENVPAGARLLAIGPSMANILTFYGHRKAYGLSVSPNPLHRNPSYEPILNPDAQIRDNELNYMVWDSFSAARSPFFARKLDSYIRKYNGRVVHTETTSVQTPNGLTVFEPVIIIYEVRP